MKIKSTLLILLTLIITSGSLTAQERDSFTIEFITLGNCYTCKIRIEAKLNMVEGVTNSDYDAYEKVTRVTYDDMITDAFLIMQAVADTGHDTEWFRAPDEAYELLIGTCCEYNRTMDYDEAQIGYLSLMDLWMPHVSINEIGDETNVRVYPTASNGQFTVNIGDLSGSEVKVYSMSGALVLTKKVETNSDNSINISNAPKGQYIICVSSNNRIISKTKIIKL